MFWSARRETTSEKCSNSIRAKPNATAKKADGAYAMPTYRQEFGLTEAEFLKATLKQLARAEELGFDSLWVNEHHFHQYGGLMPSLPTMLPTDGVCFEKLATIGLM